MAVIFKLKPEFASFGGGTVAIGPYSTTFDVGAALTAGGGQIVATDQDIIDALLKYYPLFVFGNTAANVRPSHQARFRSVSVATGLASTDSAFEVHRDNEQYPRFQILADGTMLSGVGGTPPGEFLPDANNLTVPNGFKIIENFGSGHGWTDNGVGVFSDQAAEINADRSYQIQTSGVGTESVGTKTGMGPFDLTDRHVKVAIQLGFTARLVNTKIRLASGNISTNYAEYTLATQASSSMLFDAGWHNVTAPTADFTIVGTVDWTNITSAQVCATDNGTGIITVKFGGIMSVPTLTQPVISIMFDDGYASQYTIAMKRMARYHMPAAVCVITDAIDTATFLTSTQLQQLHDFQDWDLYPHALTLTNHNLTLGLESLNDADCLTEMSGLRTWFTDRGYSTRIMVYPKGNRGGSVLKYARRFFGAGRGTTKGPETAPPGDPFYLRGWAVDGLVDTAATVTAFVDRTIATNSWGIITLHNIVTGTPASSTEFKDTDLFTVIDYINSTGVLVKKAADVLDAVGAGRMAL